MLFFEKGRFGSILVEQSALGIQQPLNIQQASPQLTFFKALTIHQNNFLMEKSLNAFLPFRIALKNALALIIQR